MWSGRAVAALAAGACVVVGGGATGAYAVLDEPAQEAERYAETRLLFGTARPEGGEPVSEAEFRRFVDEVVTPRFPEGLTVQQGYGQWRDAHGVVEEEASYELTLLYPVADAEASDREIEEVRDAYVRGFGQEAVARVDDTVLVDF
ncbi:DUF3574 domain-containing protein [Streptomyces sp. B6B3]|uniref:DUF3574 domain-containing protein n=1 Tax=Streptomyces sp. B6B3 TaxID=3153570 RepID=UPI00325F4845